MKLHDIAGMPSGKAERTVVVPFAYEEAVLGCLARLAHHKLARVMFVGEERKTREAARRHRIDVEGAEFVEETDEAAACEKAVAEVLDGRAQVLMKGLVQTASFMRAILHNKRNLLVPGRLLSMVSVFEIPSYPKLLLLTDPAVNISPDLERKKQIIRNAVEIAQCIGIARPRVACVESIEKVNPKIRGTVEAGRLAELGQQGWFGDAFVDGPFGLDVAVSPEAARVKGIGGPVAGRADVIMLPDLAAANTVYKSLVWFAGAKVANIMVGVRAPVVITSRSDAEEAKFLSLALAVHVAGAMRRHDEPRA